MSFFAYSYNFQESLETIFPFFQFLKKIEIIIMENLIEKRVDMI